MDSDTTGEFGQVNGLRILVADGPGARVDEVARAIAHLGHEVIARDSGLDDVGAITSRERVDVALVIVHDGTQHALQSIDRIVHEATCPVIAVIDVEDRAFVNEAAKRGIFAYVIGGEDTVELQSAIDIVLRRFAEYHNLEGAFGRRAVTERAKGVLMERHHIGEREAFVMLREEARRTQRKLIDVAEMVLGALPLLPSHGTEPGADKPATETSANH